MNTPQCVVCGYDLRLTSPSAVCPECATPVAQSLQDDAVRYSDPNWRMRVGRGLLLVRIGWFSILVLFALRIAALVIADAAHIHDGYIEILQTAFAGLFSLAIIATGVGVWQVLQPDERNLTTRSMFETLARPSAFLAIPGFAFWWFFVLHKPPVLLSATQHLIVHACLLAVSIHIFILVRKGDELEARSSSLTAARAQQLRGYAILAVGLPAIALVFCWVGVLRSLDAGHWSLPTSKTYKALFFLMGFAWFLATGLLGRCRRLAEFRATPVQSKVLDADQAAE